MLGSWRRTLRRGPRPGEGKGEAAREGPKGGEDPAHPQTVVREGGLRGVAEGHGKARRGAGGRTRGAPWAEGRSLGRSCRDRSQEPPKARAGWTGSKDEISGLLPNRKPG